MKKNIEKRKLISLGGEHAGKRRVFRTKSGQGWVLFSSKPINWTKVICYAIVIAAVVALIASLIQYANTAPDADKEPIVFKKKSYVVKKMVLDKYNEEQLQQVSQEEVSGYVFVTSISWEELETLTFEVKEEDAEWQTLKENVEKTKIPVTDYDSRLRTTEDRIRCSMKILTEEYGFTPEAAAGVLGNALVESQLKPNAANGEDYFGIFQWSVYWWAYIQSWLSNNGYDIYSFEGQIRSAIKCSKSGCMTRERWEELKTLTNVDQSTELFAVFYEGCIGWGEPTEYYFPGTKYQSLTLRKSEASEALSVYYGEEYRGQKPYYSY